MPAFLASFDGIEIQVPDGKGIYPPSEDSYLLLDLLKKFIDTRSLATKHFGSLVLDMGSGAGLATLYLARYFKMVHSVDINPHALAFIKREITKRDLNKRVHVIASDLFNAFKNKTKKNNYFLACFNPPYLPEENYEILGVQDVEDRNFYLDKALYSKNHGKDLISKFFHVIKDLIEPGGHVFFNKSSLTGIDNIQEWVHTFGFQVVDMVKIHLFFEDIEAYHAIK